MFEQISQNISLHGLGFIQVKLGGNLRLHVWHPLLPKRACYEHSQIHNHRFGFTSRIIIGKQTNIQYSVEQVLVAREGKLHYGYTHEGMRSDKGNRPWLLGDSYQVKKQREDTYGPGHFYSEHPGNFHATKPEGNGMVATLMEKTIETSIPAISLCEAGIRPEVDFDRHQLSYEDLWNVVEEVLGQGPSPTVLNSYLPKT